MVVRPGELTDAGDSSLKRPGELQGLKTALGQLDMTGQNVALAREANWQGTAHLLTGGSDGFPSADDLLGGLSESKAPMHTRGGLERGSHGSVDEKRVLADAKKLTLALTTAGKLQAENELAQDLTNLRKHDPAKYNEMVKELSNSKDGDFAIRHDTKTNQVIVDYTDSHGQKFESEGLPSAFSVDEIAKDGSNGIIQAQHEDCWFEASLASLAQTRHGQEMIHEMIRKSDDGYVVTFPGEPGREIFVSNEQIKQFKPDSNEASWAKVIECAASKVLPAEFKNGGNPAIAIRLLTGEGSQSYDLSHASAETTEQAASEAIAEKHVVVAYTDINVVPKSDPQDVFKDTDNNGGDKYGPPVVGDHTYQVVDVDDKHGLITLRNPWGTNVHTIFANENGHSGDAIEQLPNGEIRMSIATYRKYFGEMVVEK